MFKLTEILSLHTGDGLEIKLTDVSLLTIKANHWWHHWICIFRFYSEIRCIVQCVCKLWRNFGFFCSGNHLSGPLRTYMFTGMSSKGHGLWFVIGGFRSVLFVSGFKVRCFVIVLFWGNNRLVELALQVFLIFLIPVTCKNKATSASFLWQKIHSPSQFPSLFLSSLGSISAKLGEHVTLWLH